MTRILVTGADGVLGRAVVRAALQKGVTVRAWTHRPAVSKTSEIQYIDGDIQDVVLADTATKNVEIVLHLAARKRDEPDSHDVNVDGSRILAEAARRNGVSSFIYVSTQSAKLKEQGVYAKTKREGEDAVRSVFPNVTVIRPSLLIGDTIDGLIGTLMSAVALLFTPVFGSGQAIFRPMHIDDLSVALITLALKDESKGKVMDAGGSEEYTFIELLHLLRGVRGSRGKTVKLPVWMGLIIAKVLSHLPHPPITRSNVIGGNEVVPMDVGEFRRLGEVQSRPLAEALRSAWQKTKIGKEPALLLGYIGAKPMPSLVERYSQACRLHNREQAIDTSRFLLPLQDAWTKLYEKNGVLQDKLLIAAAIYEADIHSANALLPRERSLAIVILQSILYGLYGAVMIIACHILFLFPARTRHGV